MKKQNILEMTKMAVVVAIIMVLGLTPVGYIMVGQLQITTVHAAVIIIAIVFGLKMGGIAGAVFGITSIITAFTVPNLFSPIFYNPLVSVLPRIILGGAAYFLFKFFLFLFKKIGNERMRLSVSAGITAALSTLIHTLLVLGLIWVFRWMSPSMTSEMLNISMLSIAMVNLPSELILATIFASLIVPVLYPFFNKTSKSADTDDIINEVIEKEIEEDVEERIDSQLDSELMDEPK